VCERAGLPCRLGGEEFVALLPGAGLDAAVSLAESLRTAVEAMRVRHLGKDLPPVTVSIGVAALPEHGGDFETALKVADEALYAAKARGRNRVVKPGAGEELGALAKAS
jgi:diguanylate cyclase (GGDEF)-like protein